MKLSKYSKTRPSAFTQLKTCILLPVLIGLAYSSFASAGVIDEPLVEDFKNRGQANAASKSPNKTKNDLAKEVRKELKALEKQSKSEQKDRADKGKRLAQVVVANDFAEEAQQLTFAPAAANAALSDAMKYYALAAQRGFPGAASIEGNGVSFSPMRVVRNK